MVIMFNIWHLILETWYVFYLTTWYMMCMIIHGMWHMEFILNIVEICMYMILTFLSSYFLLLLDNGYVWSWPGYIVILLIWLVCIMYLFNRIMKELNIGLVIYCKKRDRDCTIRSKIYVHSIARASNGNPLWW